MVVDMYRQQHENDQQWTPCTHFGSRQAKDTDFSSEAMYIKHRMSLRYCPKCHRTYWKDLK